jgi:hypothetical protein
MGLEIKLQPLGIAPIKGAVMLNNISEVGRYKFF